MSKATEERLGPTDVGAWLKERDVAFRLVVDIGDTPTVLAAAEALGVAPERVLKTILFLVRTGQSKAPVVVVSHGLKRVDSRSLAAHFGVGRGRIRLAPPEVVLARLGYPVGGVPPVGHRLETPVLFDESLFGLDDGPVYAGGGDDKTMLEVDFRALVGLVQPETLVTGGDA